jgi:hypothetical protein
MPAFTDFVGHVICLRPKKKVSRIHAPGVIATVKDLYPISKVPEMYEPRNHMRVDSDAFKPSTPNLPIARSFVVGACPACGPFPASIHRPFNDLPPKPGFDSSIKAMSRERRIRMQSGRSLELTSEWITCSPRAFSIHNILSRVLGCFSTAGTF